MGKPLNAVRFCFYCSFKMQSIQQKPMKTVLTPPRRKFFAQNGHKTPDLNLLRKQVLAGQGNNVAHRNGLGGTDDLIAAVQDKAMEIFQKGDLSELTSLECVLLINALCMVKPKINRRKVCALAGVSYNNSRTSQACRRARELTDEDVKHRKHRDILCAVVASWGKQTALVPEGKVKGTPRVKVCASSLTGLEALAYAVWRHGISVEIVAGILGVSVLELSVSLIDFQEKLRTLEVDDKTVKLLGLMKPAR